MPASFFYARLVAHRPDGHAEFLQGQLAAGTLVVAGPVLDPKGVFGVAVFEAESMDALQRLLERDPARAVGRYEVAPMGPAVARPARPL